jgi:hypothetical protein
MEASDQMRRPPGRPPVAGDLGTCPGCGEYVSLSRVSDAEKSRCVPNWVYCSPIVPLHMGVESGLLGESDMEHEFSNERRAGAPGDRSSGPESRYAR